MKFNSSKLSRLQNVSLKEKLNKSLNEQQLAEDRVNDLHNTLDTEQVGETWFLLGSLDGDGSSIKSCVFV